MFSLNLKSFVSEYLSYKSEGIINKIEDNKVKSAARISSLALNTIEQLQAISGTSNDVLDADEVCLLTAILSICSDSDVASLISKVPYAKRYMDILRAYDKSTRSQDSLHSCIENIVKLFELDPQGQVLAIAHLIDTRSIALDEIPISYIKLIIPYVRVATILSDKLDAILPDVLSKGSNIEYLYINKSNLTLIPTLPNCEKISLMSMHHLSHIAMQPECKKLDVKWALYLRNVDEMPKCQFFSLQDVSSELKILPSDMPCTYFCIHGIKYATWPNLQKLPKLDSCISPQITNCILQEPLILYGLCTTPSDFEAKTGEISQCIGFRHTLYGKIFVFKIKDEFNFYKIRQSDKTLDFDRQWKFLESKISQHELKKYPAVERGSDGIRQAIKEPLKMANADTEESLFALGYNYFEDNNAGEIYFSIPASDTLQNCWRQLQGTYTDLPDLKIFDSNGIATNEDFIGAFLSHDVVVSSNGEFLHDHFIHVIPTLRCMGLKNYQSNKECIKELFIWGHKYLVAAKDSKKLSSEEYNSLEHLLGYIVDICSSNIEDFYSDYLSPFLSRKIPYDYFFTFYFVVLLNGNLDDDLFVNMDNKKLYEDMKISSQLWKKIVSSEVLETFDKVTDFLNEE